MTEKMPCSRKLTLKDPDEVLKAREEARKKEATRTYSYDAGPGHCASMHEGLFPGSHSTVRGQPHGLPDYML